MRNWIYLTLLGALFPRVGWAEINVTNLPASLRVRTLADETIQGVPVPNSGEIGQFLQNLAASAAEASANDEKLRQEYLSALKKALVRGAAPGVFEVDFNPEDRTKFSNPDLAALQNGQIIFYYSRLIGDASLLQYADVYLRRDGAGQMHFYKDGTEISTFEAFSRLALENFISGFSPALTPQQQSDMRAQAAAKAVIPLGLKPSGGTWSLKLFDPKAKAVLYIPAGIGRQAPSFLDCFQALKDYRRPS